MSIYFVMTGYVPAGRFASPEEADALMSSIGDDAALLSSPEELFEAYKGSEAELRKIRTALTVMKDPARKLRREGDLELAMKEEAETNKELQKRYKGDDKGAAVTWEMLLAHDFSVRDDEGNMPKKIGAKDFIRTKFPNIGDRVSFEDLQENGARSIVTLRTAITDLKNDKYCGKGGLLILDARKVEGKIVYERIA